MPMLGNKIPCRPMRTDGVAGDRTRAPARQEIKSSEIRAGGLTGSRQLSRFSYFRRYKPAPVRVRTSSASIGKERVGTLAR